METHAVQNLLPLRLRGKQLRSLHVASEDRIRKRGRRLVGSVNDDLDVARSDLPDNLPDARESRGEQERLASRLVIDRGVREPKLEGPQVAFTNRQAAADCAEPLRDRLHVIAEGQMVLQERFQATLQGLVINLQESIDEGIHVELLRVRDELVENPVRVGPPEPHEVLAGEELLNQITQGDVHDLAERRVDDQESIERLDDNPVVRGDRRAGLAVVRMLLDEPLRAGLVDWPRLLEVIDRLRDPVLGEPRINLLPDPADALREAERDGQHLAVPARDHRVRVGDRGHVDHAVLPDLLDLPRTSADDEVQALARLDHHELLAEDADLPLRRQVHDRVAALVADRREVLEVVATALWRDADPVAFLADDAEVGEEFGDAIRLGIFELPVRIRRANRREDVGPWSCASLVERGADDLVGEHIQGEAMDVARFEIVLLCSLDRGEGLDRIVRRHREDQPAGGAVEFVA